MLISSTRWSYLDAPGKWDDPELITSKTLFELKGGISGIIAK
ncbi:MAG: hypothetical protein ACI9IA_002209 [Enterobacterales bacterium]|jgi:hypothetical protein